MPVANSDARNLRRLMCKRLQSEISRQGIEPNHPTPEPGPRTYFMSADEPAIKRPGVPP